MVWGSRLQTDLRIQNFQPQSPTTQQLRYEYSRPQSTVCTVDRLAGMVHFAD